MGHKKGFNACFLFVLFIFSSQITLFSSNHRWMVKAKVANLCAFASKKKRFDGRGFDRNILSQVLKGDVVESMYKDRGWVCVRVSWMKILARGRLFSLTGWIEKKKLRSTNKAVGPAKSLVGNFTDVSLLRKSIVMAARRFLDAPYLWGGRSYYNKKISLSGQETGADCSGLVSLCYQLNGLVVPRNTKSQHFACRKLSSGKLLKPGDLMFLSSTNSPAQIGHVLMYLGRGEFLHATWKIGKKVINKVIISRDVEYLGRPVAKIKNGHQVKFGKYAFFGTFF